MQIIFWIEMGSLHTLADNNYHEVAKLPSNKSSKTKQNMDKGNIHII